jgi:hypothetical protein
MNINKLLNVIKTPLSKFNKLSIDPKDLNSFYNMGLAYK